MPANRESGDASEPAAGAPEQVPTGRADQDPTVTSRRKFLRRLVYVPPAILTFVANTANAQAGSCQPAQCHPVDCGPGDCTPGPCPPASCRPNN